MMRYQRKCIIIIQARMGSSRLPGKVMKKINDVPLLEHIVNRMRKVEGVEKIYVATSANSENSVIVDYCKKNNLNYYVGSEDNVLSRFIDIIDMEKCETVVRVTADDPLMDFEIVNEMLECHDLGDYDYTFMKKLPIGISAEIIKAEKLAELKNASLEQDDIEHVTIYLKKHPEIYKINYMEPKDGKDYSNYSLTVDTEEQFRNMDNIFKTYGNDVRFTQILDGE